ncbi:MAG: DUF4184 family protein [Chthoniobacterales bacterium]|nr:DUF4184 family protein [Chthoniobacterales bacterium]
MPWTVSHAAAVLPLRRFSPRPLDFAALVVGSMTPDVGYYIGAFDLATLDHTLAGSFLVGLPIGAGLLLAFYLFCKPFCYVLPQPHRQALLPICPGFDGLRLVRWPSLLLSLLLGIWTHNFWDAFTHEKGWFVERIAWLRNPVVHVGSATLGLPFILQIFSTLIGFAIVATVYNSWLRSQPKRSAAEAESDRWRYLAGLAICALALLISLPAAIHAAGAKQGVLFARAIMFRTAIYAPAIALPLGLAVACFVYLRRRPI